MGKASRDKGGRYERELVRAYVERGFRASRNSNQAHPNATDADPKGDLLGIEAGGWHLHVQAKFVERLNIWAALDQATADAPPGVMPTVHFRRSRTDTHVAIPWDWWINLLSELDVLARRCAELEKELLNRREEGTEDDDPYEPLPF